MSISPEPYNELVQRLFCLEGRVALVTGASSGIGRQMASVLASAGAGVVLVSRRKAQLRSLADDISTAGGSAEALAVDLMGIEDFRDVAASAALPFGPPDILVNAAGINLRQHADEVTSEGWESTLRLNLTVPFFLAQALVPGMREKGAGNIINIASGQTYRAYENGIAYGASKGGVGQLTRAMAQAWSRDGIVANAILPGFFETELTAPVFSDPARAAHHANATAIGRNGDLSRDLDGATIFLASRSASYITGQILAVDGGLMAV